jgi:CO/xanthine dehydrogenase Mo-binding subunit
MVLRGFKMGTTLDDIIEEGIAIGTDERARNPYAERSTPLRLAYNAASGVIEALEALKARDGSTFDFTIREEGIRLSISTNIQIYNSATGANNTLDIFADTDGTMKVGTVTKAERGNTESIVKYVAQKAAFKGLVS